MELTESIESINKQLLNLFGTDTITGLPMWRVSWSEDQFEKRLGNYDDYTPNGLYIRTVREVRLVPKYRQWIKERYVLERLTVIPEINSEDLPTQKLTYEPMWVFETSDGKYLPPKLEAAKFVVDAVYFALGKSNMVKYVDNEANAEAQNPVEYRDAKVKKLQDELFGNESPVGDALAHGEGVFIPNVGSN